MKGFREMEETAIKPFDALAAYEREREWSRVIERRLSKALLLLRIEADRRELRGEDVSHIRKFIGEASL